MKRLLQHTLIAGGLTMIMSSPQAAFSDSLYSRWQMQRLLQPGAAQLKQESKGKVFIYEGLKDKEINRVMREQFERVDSMMFIGTIITDKNGKPKRDPKTGNVMFEDDDC